MTDEPDQELEKLESVVAAIAELTTRQKFDRDGTTLRRTNQHGVLQVVYFFLGLPIRLEGSATDERSEEVQIFRAFLGVRLSESIDDHWRAFPKEMELDLSTGLTDLPMPNDEAYWVLHEPVEDLARDVARVLDSAGERWFEKFASIDHALETLDAVTALNAPFLDEYPQLVAMRLRADRGERADAQRDLNIYVASRNDWPKAHLRWLAEHVSQYELTVFLTPWFHTAWSAHTQSASEIAALDVTRSAPGTPNAQDQPSTSG